MKQAPAPTPVSPSAKSPFRLVADVLDHAGPGYLQFAITNVCNADCDFCGFARSKLDRKTRHSVTLDDARLAIDIAARNHIGYLLFVGGEPMAHPDLEPMIRHAAAAGVRPMLCTNGALWNDRNLTRLTDAGLSSVIMSVDAHDIGRHEKNRGLPGVCDTIRKANAHFRAAGIQTTASVTASRLIDDYEQLPDFLESLGFSSCTFSYPLTHLDSSYLSFSDSGLVDFNRDELLDLFEKIRQMKRRSGFPVVNPDESLREMQRHLRGEKEHYLCLGGHKYFYLDWNLDLYRCHQWDSPMCKIHDFGPDKLIRDGCQRCMIDCYRDPSVLQHLAVNASDAWHSLRKGRLWQAGRHLLDRRNLTSLKAVWEERKWIRKV